MKALKGGDTLHVIGGFHVNAFLASSKTANVGTFASFGRKVF